MLERIKASGDIFMAHSDRPWILDGAVVHVSIVGFDNGMETERKLDGEPVAAIYANLATGVDLTTARRLKENADISFIGDMKKGKFEITESDAFKMIGMPPNPNGRPNSEVVRPWVNGLDITRRPRNMWIIDFDMNMSESEAALYEAPFEYIKHKVKPARDKVRNELERRRWWVHGRTAPDLRQAIQGLKRYIATPRVAKHRLFVFLDEKFLPDGALVAIARNDDYTFGVLHSRYHEVWARATGTQLREAESGFRYSHTATFETFPFPRPTDEQRGAIAEAARDLNRLREGWLNPVGADGKPVMFGVDLRKRTLTNLYNDYEGHTWLVNAHDRLNSAVTAAYGWDVDISDEQVLDLLLALNIDRYKEEGS